MDEAALIQNLNGRFEKLIRDAVRPPERIIAKLPGTFKEALVCTDRRVLIFKYGLMTGNLFRDGLFQMNYEAISAVEVKFGILSGHFEVVAGGVQYTPKSAWPDSKGKSPQASPNCVSLDWSNVKKFRQVCGLIMGRKASSPGVSVLGFEEHERSLEKISSMRSKGLINSKEFEAKKAEILARI